MQELRLLAHLSQEPQFIKALKEKKDLHAYSASLLFNIPYRDFFDYLPDGSLDRSKDSDGFNKEMKKKYRNPAKSITFGLIYGMGPKKLAATLKITYEEAKDLLQKYFQIFPKIKNLMDSIEEQTLKTKVAYSPLDNRYRDLSHVDWIHKKKAAHAINQAKNMPFQGCGASVTKLAMCRIRRILKDKKYDARLVLTVHDEILVECNENIVDTVAKIVEEQMKAAFNHYAPSVEMDVTAKIADRWLH